MTNKYEKPRNPKGTGGFKDWAEDTHRAVSAKAGRTPKLITRTLSAEQVREIRRSTKPLAYLADKYQVNPTTVHRIRIGTTYKDIL